MKRPTLVTMHAWEGKIIVLGGICTVNAICFKPFFLLSFMYVLVVQCPEGLEKVNTITFLILLYYLTLMKVYDIILYLLLFNIQI